MEQWKPVVGFERFYEVSNLGRVRSLHWGAPRMLADVRSSSGYMVVSLRGNGNRSGVREVHRLVLEAFVGLPKLGQEACHGNAVRHDNRLENLRWGTRAENLRDMDAHGNRVRGEGIHNARLTEAMVRQIRASVEDDAIVAERLGVPKQCVYRVRKGISWRHVA